MKSQMKAADRSGARYAVILGEDEIRAGTALIKPLRSGEDQQSVSSGDLAARLMEKIQ
jgi:histidyl-tRNA synthetase